MLTEYQNNLKTGTIVNNVTDNSNHSEVIFIRWDGERAVVINIDGDSTYKVCSMMISLTTQP